MLRILLISSTLVMMAPSARAEGDTPPKPADPAKARQLVLSPAAAPIPSLKYRLLPSVSELQPGDAAPLYLRIRHDLRVGPYVFGEKGQPMLDTPFDKFPRKEARELVDGWKSRYRQIEFGARRETCNWNYSLREQRENAISILLPDAQDMREWGRLVALKARVEIADGRLDDAAHTLETGIAFGKHVGSGPFLINYRVGQAIVGLMLNEVEEFISQPGSPNLYWALTTLPRPLVDYRGAIEVEQGIVEGMVPELTDLDSPRSEVEWKARLMRLHSRLLGLSKQVGADDSNLTKELAAMEGMAFEQVRERMLPDARRFVDEPSNKSVKAGKIGDDQAIVLLIAHRYRTLQDAVFQNAYLPYAEMAARSPRAEALLAAAKSQDPASAVLAALLPPLLPNALRASALGERRVAALRVIEALRLHLGTHGQLPGRLGDLIDVPVPVDPATGQPFHYGLEGGKATLSAPAIDGKPETALLYKLSTRK
jgi:hypothetical protein